MDIADSKVMLFPNTISLNKQLEKYSYGTIRDVIISTLFLTRSSALSSSK